MAISKDTTTLPGHTILYEANTGIVIDYSAYYERVATALENISASLGGDSSTLSSIVSGIESNLTTMATNSTTIKDLASGGGIHMVGPLDWLGLVSSYKLYVEDTGAIGLTALREYKTKIDALPKAF